jgi:hypothetical protein
MPLPRTPWSTSQTFYERAVLARLWRWADAHHQGQLDGGRRAARPPVLAAAHADANVLVVEEGPRGCCQTKVDKSPSGRSSPKPMGGYAMTARHSEKASERLSL